MVSEKARAIIQHLQAVISDDYGQEARKLEFEIGLERYNETVEYLTSLNILESVKFESGKYRTNFKNQPNKNAILELIEKLEKQELIV